MNQKTRKTRNKSMRRWNADKHIRASHNCYAYFLNKIDRSATARCKRTQKCQTPQPGFHHGISEKSHHNYSCKSLIKRVQLDNPGIRYLGKNPETACPKRHYKGALVRTTAKTKTDKCNYHFYRQDRDRRWSHKDGPKPATDRDAKGRLIVNPSLAARNYKDCDYDDVCGYFCVPRNNDNDMNMSWTNRSLPIPQPQIRADFECGNIKVVAIQPDNIVLEIANEPYLPPTPHNLRSYGPQNKYENWFYFKATNLGPDTAFTLQNVHNFDNAWKGFTVCYSHDNRTWKRLVDTRVHKAKAKANASSQLSTITWTYKAKANADSPVWFAYYVPYPFSRTQRLFPRAETIGHSIEKRPILLQRYGHGPIKVWLISGQHPGETIHAWMLEGFVKRLLARKAALITRYTFYIVPNANPDGNAAGHWYTTARSINMNRDWAEQTRSPEVSTIKAKIAEIGCDLAFDLHGDEGATRHFFTHSYLHKHPLHDAILQHLVRQTHGHFQMRDHYPIAYIKASKERTLDAFTRGITVEGAMKHPIYHHKTLQDEPLGLGKALADALNSL